MRALSTASTALQISIAGVSVAADTEGLATVMGPAVNKAGVQTSGGILATIKEDLSMKEALDANKSLLNSEKIAIRKCTRILMQAYAAEVSESVLQACVQYYDVNITTPTVIANADSSAQVKRVIKMITEV